MGKRACLWNSDQHCCLSCSTAVQALPLATSSIFAWIGDVSSHLFTRRLSWLRGTFSSMSAVNVFVLKTENVASIEAGNDVGFQVSHGNSNLFHVLKGLESTVSDSQSMIDGSEAINQKAFELMLGGIFASLSLLIFVGKRLRKIPLGWTEVHMPSALVVIFMPRKTVIEDFVWTL